MAEEEPRAKRGKGKTRKRVKTRKRGMFLAHVERILIFYDELLNLDTVSTFLT